MPIPLDTQGNPLPPPCPPGQIDTLPEKYWGRYWRMFPKGDRPSWCAVPKPEPPRRSEWVD